MKTNMNRQDAKGAKIGELAVVKNDALGVLAVHSFRYFQ